MLIDQQGNLLLTLASFTDPSVLARFGVAGDGTFNGSSSTLLQDTDRLGEIRLHDDSLYFSSGNQIFEIVPEPATVFLIPVGALLFAAGNLRGRAGG